MKIEENEVYTTKEVAEILKISLPTIKRMLKDGRLPSARIGRQHRFLGKYLLEIMRSRRGPDRADVAPAGAVSEQQPAAAQAPPRTQAYQPAAPPWRQSAFTPPPPPAPEPTPEQRQRSYMLGKRLRADLRDSDGSVIFPGGTPVTDEVIREAGRRQKLMELLSNLEK